MDEPVYRIKPLVWEDHVLYSATPWRAGETFAATVESRGGEKSWRIVLASGGCYADAAGGQISETDWRDVGKQRAESAYRKLIAEHLVKVK